MADKAYLQDLLAIAETYNSDRNTFYEIGYAYRNKSESFFHRNRHSLRTLIKDNNGDPRSPINGRLAGVFLSVGLINGDFPERSPFGNTRIHIPIEAVFNEHTNLYFTDFYCTTSDVHYVTLVLARRSSPEDKFCKKNVLPLDPRNNAFLRRSSNVYKGHEMYSTVMKQRFHLEIFYTHNINLNRLIAKYGPETVCFSRTETIGRGHSTRGGLPKNPTCSTCNIHSSKSLNQSKSVHLGNGDGRSGGIVQEAPGVGVQIETRADNVFREPETYTKKNSEKDVIDSSVATSSYKPSTISSFGSNPKVDNHSLSRYIPASTTDKATALLSSATIIYQSSETMIETDSRKSIYSRSVFDKPSRYSNEDRILTSDPISESSVFVSKVQELESSVSRICIDLNSELDKSSSYSTGADLRSTSDQKEVSEHSASASKLLDLPSLVSLNSRKINDVRPVADKSSRYNIGTSDREQDTSSIVSMVDISTTAASRSIPFPSGASAAGSRSFPRAVPMSVSFPRADTDVNCYPKKDAAGAPRVNNDLRTEIMADSYVNDCVRVAMPIICPVEAAGVWCRGWCTII